MWSKYHGATAQRPHMDAGGQKRKKRVSMPKVLARKMCTKVQSYIWYSSDYSTCVKPSSAFFSAEHEVFEYCRVWLSLLLGVNYSANNTCKKPVRLRAEYREDSKAGQARLRLPDRWKQ